MNIVCAVDDDMFFGTAMLLLCCSDEHNLVVQQLMQCSQEQSAMGVSVWVHGEWVGWEVVLGLREMG